MLDKAELQNLKHLVDRLKEEGFSGIRFYITKTRELVASIKPKGNIDCQNAEDTMYSIEAGYQGKKSRIYANQSTDCEAIIEAMKMTAEVYEDYIEHVWAESAGEEVEKEFHWDHTKEVLPVLLAVEKKAYGLETISLVHQCRYEQKRREIYFVDERMKSVKDLDGYHCFKFGVVSKKEAFTEVAAGCIYGKAIKQMDVSSCVDKTIDEAAAALGGEALTSGPYDVMISGRVMSELLEAYIPAFYADNIQNMMSGLGDKRGEQIAASHVYLKEIPEFEEGRNIRSIDDEGTPATEKYLIREGIMEQILYNHDSAKRDGVRSTGNGFRSSIQSDIEIGVTNVVFGTEIPERIKTQKEMKELLENGLLITSVDGVFAGTNSKTGAFSLIAKGQRIRDGIEQGGVCEVTIAGNFFKMLNHITYISMDADSTWPDMQCVLSPSVMAGKIIVSGK